MRYPVVIEPGDKRHVHGVVVPDLPGCFSAGDTLDEALANAREAVVLHLEGLLDAGESIPTPTPVETLRKEQAYQDWIWALIDVDLSAFSDKAVRVNVTLPARLLSVVDDYAKRHGETRSGFLAQATIAAMRTGAKNHP